MNELGDAERILYEHLLYVRDRRRTAEQLEEQIKAELLDRLTDGQWAHNGERVFSIRGSRRFDPERARKVIPPELLPECLAPSAAEAKKVLSPDMYAQCQSPGRRTLTVEGA